MLRIVAVIIVGLIIGGLLARVAYFIGSRSFIISKVSNSLEKLILKAFLK